MTKFIIYYLEIAFVFGLLTRVYLIFVWEHVKHIFVEGDDIPKILKNPDAVSIIYGFMWLPVIIRLILMAFKN